MAKKKDVKTDDTIKEVSLAQRKKSLDDFCNKFNKSAGKVMFGRLSECPELLEQIKTTFIPSASYRVNNALGGGWPRKRISVVTGMPDSGKTLRLLEDIAYNQKKDPDFIAGWIETEHSITLDDLVMFGVDLERFYFFDTNNKLSGEQVADMMISALLSQKIDFLVVNSLKNLLSQQELEGLVADNQIGAAARMNSKFCRKILPVISETNTALIFVQTLSTKIGVMFGNPMQMSGGFGIRYNAAIIAEMNSLTLADKDPINKDDGRKFSFTVKKNHIVSNKNPYVRIEYYTIYGQGTDRLLELIDFAEEIGFIEKAGAFIKVPDEDGNPKVIDGVKLQWQGLAKFRAYCLSNKEFYEEMEKAVMASDIASEKLSEKEIEEIKAEEKSIKKMVEDNSEDDVIEKAAE